MERSNFDKATAQRRFFTGKLESRAAGDGTAETFGGIAATVGVEYVLWEGENTTYSEVIQRGAFANAGGFDVRVLKNHNINFLLGRTEAKTAKVWEDESGNLAYEWQNEPAITYASDLAASIRRGDTRESSFGFYIGDEIWEESRIDGKVKYKRTILNFAEIFDVSPVTYPANNTTTVTEKRDLESAVQAFFEKNPPATAGAEQTRNSDLLRLGLENKRKQILNTKTVF